MRNGSTIGLPLRTRGSCSESLGASLRTSVPSTATVMTTPTTRVIRLRNIRYSIRPLRPQQKDDSEDQALRSWDAAGNRKFTAISLSPAPECERGVPAATADGVAVETTMDCRELSLPAKCP